MRLPGAPETSGAPNEALPPSPPVPRASRRRIFVIVALATVMVVVAGVVVVLASNGEGGGGQAKASAPAGAPIAPGPVAQGQAGPAYVPQPDLRFISVGTNTGQQFTDDQFRVLADNFGVVMFAKFHAGWDITKQHEAASRLMAMKPDMKVYPYFSTKYWFDQNRWNGATINPAWFLRDNQGKLVGRDRKKDRNKSTAPTLVDLANPEYRKWALGVMKSWLDAAPYAGIFFDAAEPIGDFGDADVARYAKLLGPERVKAYNDGMRQLLADAEKLVGPGRSVLFNGIAPSDQRGPDRNLDLLQATNGALDEFFCLDSRGNVRGIDADLSLLGQQPDKRFFMRTNYRASLPAADRDRLQRLCLGSFLLAWEPGHSSFSFGGDYTADQLGMDPPDSNVNLGAPTDAYRRTGTLLERGFANGVVYVNPGTSPQQVVLDAPLTEVRGGKVVATRQAGETVTVAPGDASFFVR
ncbi:MAG: putative glycoside hydrolase family 15 protein [Actinomycetota bacterium]|nr:putative glycoside hydrolase family 15 protein [Actinomycetota bacterium]